MLGCIVYLVGSKKKFVDDFKHSLMLLKRNYLNDYPTDVICFHEADLSPDTRQDIESVSGIHLIWIEVKFTIPDWIDRSKLWDNDRVGYCHMCRFWTSQVWKRPILDNYQYCLRLDTDSEILSPVGFNLFEEMKRRNAIYGYVQGSDNIMEQPQFVSGLQEVLDQAGYRYYSDLRHVYYTNFEICKIDWFRSEDWSKFANVVDNSGLHFYSRLGDHVCRWIGLHLLANQKDIYSIRIHYRHQPFEWNKT